jgi:hypothetical protein
LVNLTHPWTIIVQLYFFGICNGSPKIKGCSS